MPFSIYGMQIFKEMFRHVITILPATKTKHPPHHNLDRNSPAVVYLFPRQTILSSR